MSGFDPVSCPVHSTHVDATQAGSTQSDYARYILSSVRHARYILSSIRHAVRHPFFRHAKARYADFGVPPRGKPHDKPNRRPVSTHAEVFPLAFSVPASSSLLTRENVQSD